jgi:hypothetical protein
MNLIQNENSNTIQNFFNIYNTTDHEILVNDHMYFRYMCFKYIKLIRNIHIDNFEQNNKNEAVLIEYRCFPHVEFLIRNTIIKLSNNWSHTVICGNLNYDFMVEMCKNISPNIKIIKTNYNNLVPSEYSKLLTSLSFWKLLHGEKILIYQEDSIIFHKNIEKFLHFDYIGAPFPKRHNDTPNSVGNGGLSLRSKNIMIKIINTISVEDTIFEDSTLMYMSNTNSYFPPEDIYFSKNMQELNIGKVADWDSAYQFSSERIYNPNSFGGHKFWISNSKWKSKLKTLFKYLEYRPHNDILKYLKYNKISKHLDRTKDIKNAFDVDLFFCSNVNKLNTNNTDEILKYIKQTGIKGFIYHPKQIFNIYPMIKIYNFMNDIYISHNNNIYTASNFTNEYIYNKTYEELYNKLIKKKFDALNSEISLLILVFIGNEDRGGNLINKIIEYKKIQKINVSFCFNSNEISKKFKNKIKDNFKNYSIYISKDFGTDITPTLLMYDDISKNYNFKHIIKLHTKSITDQYEDLTDYLLSVPLATLILKKRVSNCIGHEKYHVYLKNDIFNKILLFNHHTELNINKTFVAGTIFYSENKVFDSVLKFIKKNNFRSYVLNNLYENNTINKNYSPIHFLERLFGVIHI